MKTCSLCKSIKGFECFSKAIRESDGLQSRCKSCNAWMSKKYRKTHKQKERLRHKKYAVENPEKLKEKDARWRKNNPEKSKEKSRRYFYKNREKENARSLAYQNKNIERCRTQSTAWRKANPRLAREIDRLYTINNRGKVNAKNNKRRAVLLRAIPSWADLDRIRLIYEQAARITKETGISHHVDHIIPLLGKNVCGLHCAENLQIIPAHENIKKGNQF